MTEYHFQITEEEEGERLDHCLALLLADQSRTYLQKLIKDGNVKLNGGPARNSLRVSEGDKIDLSLPDKIIPDIEPENIPIDVLYEDSDVLVVNKSKGMVVHPAPGHWSGTLVNAVLYHCGKNLSGINGVLRPGIVHRIDKDTTGSVIICKNDNAHRKIAEQLKEHTIVRRYRAIVCGRIAEDTLTVSGNIGRDPKDRKKMTVVPAPQGKPAVTHVRVLERFRDYTYIECALETGRTHQIRVHMAHIGHPLLGDTLYASGQKSPFSGLQGQCLHAMILGFVHPVTGEYIETQAPLPEYFKELLRKLRTQ